MARQVERSKRMARQDQPPGSSAQPDGFDAAGNAYDAGGNVFDAGDGDGAAAAIPIVDRYEPSYRLTNARAVEIWREAQHGGLAPGIADHLTAEGVPSKALVKVTTVLCSLAVEGAPVTQADATSPIPFPKLNLDDLLELFRMLFHTALSGGPKTTKKRGASGDNETDAFESTWSVGVLRGASRSPRPAARCRYTRVRSFLPGVTEHGSGGRSRSSRT